MYIKLIIYMYVIYSFIHFFSIDISPVFFIKKIFFNVLKKGLYGTIADFIRLFAVFIIIF